MRTKKCEKCYEIIDANDRVIVTQNFIRIKVYHEKCYDPRSASFVLNSTYATLRAIFGTLGCLFVGIRAPQLWLKIFSVIGIVHLVGSRIYTYLLYENK